MNTPINAPLNAPASAPRAAVLAVDLDGTLCRIDTLFAALKVLLRRQPWQIVPVFFWWLLKGRAHCKQEIARRAQPVLADLPFHRDLIAWLQQRRAEGTRLVLATGCDQRIAQTIADHVGLFEAVLASDGHTNLTGAQKRAKLDQLYGAGHWGYAGNDWIDLKVWSAAAEVVVVNASQKLILAAQQTGKVSRVFA
jgi:hypothetical protein